MRSPLLGHGVTQRCESFCKDGVCSGSGTVNPVNEPVSILVGSVEKYVSFRAERRGPKVNTEEAIKPTLR